MTLLLEQYQALFNDTEYATNDPISILANSSAFIMEMVPDLNWAGFYLWDQQRQQLAVGPFQGKVACSLIASGSGVCGTAFDQQATQRIGDVHAFAGHIACDSATNAELVIPFAIAGQPAGVLDLDSPRLQRFSAADQAVLEELTGLIAAKLAPTS
ncbi:GAF domain-containing protein [Lapidilactobacillus achengensis]|uniref:GAF domain-containing protein n=1 Tax=Lapidilactobacillus achengensis TaxID=2486000 RepID=A0ABW1UQM9_9LACO|nr:GAF domain-containing protein [Lapidilactobacillus achengensis]